MLFLQYLGIGVLVLILVLLFLRTFFPSVVIKLRDGCERFTRACHGGAVRCLTFGSVKDTETGFLIGVTLAKWWHGLTCAAVFGEVPLLVLRAARFMGIRANIPFLENSPLLGFLAGISVWLAPTIWLLVWLESHELLPPWLWLWDGIQKRKVFVRRFSGCIFLLFLVPLFLMYLHTTYQLLKGGYGLPIDVHALAVAVFHTLLVPTLAPVVIGLALGIAGISGCFLLLLFCLFTYFHFLLSLVKVKVPPEKDQYADEPGHVSIHEEAGVPVLALPEGRSSSRPVSGKEKEVPDVKVNVFSFFASHSRFAPLVHEAVQTGGGWHVSRCNAIVDFDQEYTAGAFSALGRDVTPLQQIKDIARKVGLIGEHEAYTEAGMAVGQAVAADIGSKSGTNVTLYIPLPLLPVLAPSLSWLKQRIFHGHLAVMTSRLRREQIPADIESGIRTLSRDGIQLFFLDGDADYVKSYGSEAQEKSAVSVLFTITVAKLLHSQNPKFGEIIERLHLYAPACQFVFSQAPVDCGEPDLFVRVTRKFVPKLRNRGNGSFTHLVEQAMQCTRNVAQEVQQKDMGGHIPFFVYTIPFDLASVKQGVLFGKFIEEMQTFLRGSFPDSEAIVVRGDVPVVRGMEGSQFRVSVAGLVPLSSVVAGTSEERAGGLKEEKVVVVDALNGRMPHDTKSGKRGKNSNQ